MALVTAATMVGSTSTSAAAIDEGPCTTLARAELCDTSPAPVPTRLVVTGQRANRGSLKRSAWTDNAAVAGYGGFLGRVRASMGAAWTYRSFANSHSFERDTAALESTTLDTVSYVATWGSDASPGTASAPWRTIQHALDVAQPGQTIFVHGGTYTENLLVSRSGTSTAPITLAGYPGEQPALHAASTTGNTYPIEIGSGAAYFFLEGFVIEGSLGTSAANVYVSGTAHHIAILLNEIRYGQDQGIFADRTTSDLDIIANGIHDNGWNHLSGQHQSHGIYIEGGNDLIANNLIYNHPYGFGITIYPANHDTIVTENAILASAHSSIVVGGSPGVYNITIRNNILYDDNWGVEMDSTCPTGPVAIDHNVIADYRIAPIQAGCATVDTSGGNTIADPGVAN